MLGSVKTRLEVILILFLLGACARADSASPTSPPVTTAQATAAPATTVPPPTGESAPATATHRPTVAPTVQPSETPSATIPMPQTTETPADGEHYLDQVRITILFDNYSHDERLISEWGFAALVEADDHVLLFDTGGGAGLVSNMHRMGIEPASIETVVLSHQHMDHIGGLLPLLAEGIHPTVYLLTSFPADFKAQVARLTDVVRVTTSLEILPGIYTTGPVSGGVREQALAIRMQAGSVIITGCAHPGISRMVARGRSVLQPGNQADYAPVALVVGGFHLGGASASDVEQVIADLQAMNVQRVVPTHCTGDAAIAQFADAFGDGYISGGVGRIITLP
jgi:7,8-dihydropterin-6-yl-methyl-4-(beta-D-ribofuranosyl)aminobenzene 5'-phosphate synthase